jgi:hypothetical protein
MLWPEIKAFTLAWSEGEGPAGAGAFFRAFTFPRGCTLEVACLSAQADWSTLSGAACWSIVISTTKQAASPWTWLGPTSPSARPRAEQKQENRFMALTASSRALRDGRIVAPARNAAQTKTSAGGLSNLSVRAGLVRQEPRQPCRAESSATSELISLMAPRREPST